MSLGIPKLSNKAALLMASSSKKNKKRSLNDFRSQGVLEVNQILDDHENKYGSALADQLDVVPE